MQRFLSAIVDDGVRWLVGGNLLAPLAFCAAIALLSGLAVALIATFGVSAIEPHTALKDVAARASAGVSHHRLRSSLVIAQIALSFALLAGAGLAVHSFVATASRAPGFSPDNVVVAHLLLSKAEGAGRDTPWTRFFDAALTKLGAEPGVEAVAGIDNLPMKPRGQNGPFRAEGDGLKLWEGPIVEVATITPGYFRAMTIPILRGRDFDARDVSTAPQAIILSQSAAAKLFPSGDAVGKRVTMNVSSPLEWAEVVGVVGDVRHQGLDRALLMEAYVPLAQSTVNGMSIVVKTRLPSELTHRVPALIHELAPEHAVTVESMRALVEESIDEERGQMLFLSSFSVVALLLSGLGLFGLVSYSTTQRTHEFGIRLALGCSGPDIVALVLRQGLALFAAGASVGLFGGMLMGRFLNLNNNPLVFTGAGLVLLVACVAACSWPAWRAVRVPPAAALRGA